MPSTTVVNRWARRAVPALLALAACGAWADLGRVTRSGFVVIFRHEVKASPEQVWQALTQLPHWWSDEHTYSGQATRMSLDAQAGGCWCERWGGGNSVEHGRVLQALPPRSLRLHSALGPLQELPVNGVLTFTVLTQETQTVLRLTYRVAGADAGLDKLAPQVDRVLGEQFRRLIRFAETGKAD